MGCQTGRKCILSSYRGQGSDTDTHTRADRQGQLCLETVCSNPLSRHTHTHTRTILLRVFSHGPGQSRARQRNIKWPVDLQTPRGHVAQTLQPGHMTLIKPALNRKSHNNNNNTRGPVVLQTAHMTTIFSLCIIHILLQHQLLHVCYVTTSASVRPHQKFSGGRIAAKARFSSASQLTARLCPDTAVMVVSPRRRLHSLLAQPETFSSGGCDLFQRLNPVFQRAGFLTSSPNKTKQ